RKPERHHHPVRRLRDPAAEPRARRNGADGLAEARLHPLAMSAELPESAAPAPPPAPVPPPPQPRRNERLRRFSRWFVEKYLTIDARSVGFGRVGVAVVLLVDLIRRIPVLDLFYTNEGLLPNHTLLWRPPTQWMFSFFFLASLRDEAILCFLFCG